MRALFVVLVGLGLLTVGLPAVGTEAEGTLRLPHEFLGLPAPSNLRHFEDPFAAFAAALLGPGSHLAGDFEVLAVGSQSLGRSDYGHDLVRDGAGNLVMVGGTYTGSRTNPYDIVVAKFLSTGQASWVKRFHAAPNEFAYGVAVDGEGNINVGGYRVSTSGNYVPFVAQFGPDGTYRWSKALPTATLRYAFAAGLATDEAGNILLGGYGYGSSWRAQPLAAKLSPTGVIGFVKTYPASQSEAFLDVASDGAGNLLLAGVRYNNGYDMAVRKVSPTGADLGSAVVNVGSYDQATGVTTDGTGGILLAGAAGNGGAAVVRLHPDLTTDWVRTLDLPGYVSTLDVAVDKLGGIVLGGSLYTHHCCGSDYVAAKLLPGGTPVFVRTMDLSDYDYGVGVAVTPYGGEVIVGGTSRDVYEQDSGNDLVVVRSLGASGAGAVFPTIDNLPDPDLHDTPVPVPPMP